MFGCVLTGHIHIEAWQLLTERDLVLVAPGGASSVGTTELLALGLAGHFCRDRDRSESDLCAHSRRSASLTLVVSTSRGEYFRALPAGKNQSHHPAQNCAVQICDLSKDPIGPAPWGLSSADILEKSKIRTAHF